VPDVRKTFYERVFASLGEDMFGGIRKDTIGAEFHDLPEFMRVVKILEPGMVDKMVGVTEQYGEEEYYTMFNTLLQMYSFWATGKKLFHVAPGLVDALINTGVDKCSTEFLALPFRSICLSFSKICLTIQYGGKIRGVSEVYMIEDLVRGDRLWRVLVVGNAAEDGSTGSFFFRVKVNANPKIGDGFVVAGVDKWDKPHYGQQMKDLWRFVSSIVLYMNSTEFRVKMSHNQEPKRPTKPKKARQHDRRYGNLSKLGYYNLGGNIKIGGKAPEKTSGESDLSKRFSHSYRYMVRGHMHAFWYGKKDGERIQKVRWIRPFWKGPGLAKVVSKEYSVK